MIAFATRKELGSTDGHVYLRRGKREKTPTSTKIMYRIALEIRANSAISRTCYHK